MSVEVSKRELIKRERRTEILSAAQRVFLERGLDAATMDEIARSAGLSKGALYLYFSSKDELFLTIACELLEELNARLASLEKSPHENGREKFRSLIHAYVDFALEHQSRFQVAMSWLRSSYSVDGGSSLFVTYKSEIARLQNLGFQAIERGRTDGSLVFEGCSHQFGLQLWGACFGLLSVEQHAAEISRRCSAPVSTSQLTHIFVDRYLDGVSPPSKKIPLRSPDSKDPA